MTRSRTFYAVLIPVAAAGAILLSGVASRADDDDDDDYINVDDGDDDNDAGVGNLNIATSPWAEVYVDGAKVGTTPYRGQLTAGKHKITLVNPDKKIKMSRTITISPGSNVNISQNFGGPNDDDIAAAAAAARAAAADARAAAKDQVRAAADQARAAADQARAQLEQAKGQ